MLAHVAHDIARRFGTFLCDTEKQRTDQRLKEKTVSLWSYTNCGQNRREYLNPFYVPDMSVLFPDVFFFSLSLWKGYHMRYVCACLDCAGWGWALANVSPVRTRAHVQAPRTAHLATPDPSTADTAATKCDRGDEGADGATGELPREAQAAQERRPRRQP